MKQEDHTGPRYNPRILKREIAKEGEREKSKVKIASKQAVAVVIDGQQGK